VVVAIFLRLAAVVELIELLATDRTAEKAAKMAVVAGIAIL
jgi:hypothetical protein